MSKFPAIFIEVIEGHATRFIVVQSSSFGNIGGKPAATMKECLELSLVKEAAGNEKAEEMVQIVIYDFNTVINDLKTGMKVAEEENDETTCDMLLAIHTALEKYVWMLKSFLGK